MASTINQEKIPLFQYNGDVNDDDRLEIVVKIKGFVISLPTIFYGFIFLNLILSN